MQKCNISSKWSYITLGLVNKSVIFLFQPRWISVPESLHAPVLEQKSKKTKTKSPPTSSTKKSEDQRPFEEPPVPTVLDSTGLDTLIRVSHLTTLAKQLSEQNIASYQLDMPRIRELNLDVFEAELPMLKTLLKNQNVSELEEKFEQNGIGGDRDDDEYPLTPGSPTLPASWTQPENQPVTEQNQSQLPIPSIPIVNLDASKPSKQRQRSFSNETSPVIKAKKPRRSCRSQDQPELQGK